MKVSRSLLVFPALALAVAVGCASTSDAQPNFSAKKTTTTIASKKKRPSPTTTIVKGGVGQSQTALDVLRSIPIANEIGRGYSRNLFKHWIDADGDSCNTREEVLIAESQSRAQVDPFGCKVIEGDWFSPYDGKSFTSPAELQIDHVVALKEAWDSGAWAWTSARRQSFANDLTDSRSLIAVTGSVNASKGEKDPSNWIPPRQAYLCTYLADWVAIKARWGLSMDQSEAGRIRNLLTRSCASAMVAPWGAASLGAPSDSTTGTPTTEQSTSVSSVVAVPSTVPTPSGSVGGTTGQEVNGGKRCKAIEFGQTGTYKGIPYICSNTRKDGSPYAPGYYMWRPA